MNNTYMHVYKRQIHIHNLFVAFHTRHFHRYPACLTGNGPTPDYIKLCLCG